MTIMYKKNKNFFVDKNYHSKHNFQIEVTLILNSHKNQLSIK